MLRLNDLPPEAAIRATYYCDLFPAATPTLGEAAPGVYVIHLHEAGEEVATFVLWPDVQWERSDGTQT